MDHAFSLGNEYSCGSYSHVGTVTILSYLAHHEIPVTCRKNRLSGSLKFCVIVFYPGITGGSRTRSIHTVFDWFASPTMHGTLLDQRVFESLVTRCLPMIHDHFSAVDVQLSVASLPWFLSLLVWQRFATAHQLIPPYKIHQ